MGQLTQDLPCVECGYNLRGLTLGSTCPECAAPVDATALGSWLQTARPVWLRRLGLGATVGMVAMAPVAALSLATLDSSSMPWEALAVLARAPWLGMSLASLATASVWLLTAPSGSPVESDRFFVARRLARWSSLSFLAVVPLDGLLRFGTAGGVVRLEILGMMAVAMTALLAQAATLWHLSNLARRIPRAGLARATRVVMWGYSASLLVPYLSTIPILWIMSTPQAVPGIFVALMRLNRYAYSSAVLFGIGAIVLLFVYARAFRRAATQAAQFAAAHG